MKDQSREEAEQTVGKCKAEVNKPVPGDFQRLTVQAGKEIGQVPERGRNQEGEEDKIYCLLVPLLQDKRGHEGMGRKTEKEENGSYEEKTAHPG